MLEASAGLDAVLLSVRSNRRWRLGFSARNNTCLRTPRHGNTIYGETHSETHRTVDAGRGGVAVLHGGHGGIDGLVAGWCTRHSRLHGLEVTSLHCMRRTSLVVASRPNAGTNE